MDLGISSTVVYEGWMVRFGRRKIGLSFIHVRYFILENRVLSYYKRNPKRVPGGDPLIKAFHINGDCRVEDRGLKMHQGHMMYVLCVYNKRDKNNRIMMAAFNIQEALIWKEKIEMVIDQVSLSLSSQQNESFENGRKSSSSEYESLYTDIEEVEEEEEDNQQSLLTQTSFRNGTHHVENEAMERVLFDSSAEPIELSYGFVENITNGFSQAIGSGGFGKVYMGIFKGWRVAVKKLFQTIEFSEKQFEDELTCLRRVRHKNIVRFLGYCSDTQQRVVQYEGQFVMAEDRRRLLCFEYVPNKSLHDYLKDESHGREWNTCYRLIEGICQGLRYLHNEERINHLDLKPENILLDADLVPKITDFGLSRRFSGEQSRIITENIRGSWGYIAPEYLIRGEISFKSDIFSLGVIIRKLLWGSNHLSDFENWNQSVDIHCPKVKRCIKVAQLCVDEDQHKRPTIDCIIDMLNEVCPVGGHSRNNSGSSEQELQVSSTSMQALGIRDLIPARLREFWFFRQ